MKKKVPRDYDSRIEIINKYKKRAERLWDTAETSVSIKSLELYNSLSKIKDIYSALRELSIRPELKEVRERLLLLGYDDRSGFPEEPIFRSIELLETINHPSANAERGEQ
jgi:hypothetical protein